MENEKMKIGTKICEICNAPNARTNYGAIACRACGAFFRRFVLFGMNSDIYYICNCQNEYPNVELDEADRPNPILLCKCCRLKKCIEVGMKKELVRSIFVQQFHRERQQQFMKKDSVISSRSSFKNRQIDSGIQFQNFYSMDLREDIETRLIQMLFVLYEKAEMLRKDTNIIPMEFFEQFDSLESLLIANKNNLLSISQMIKTKHCADVFASKCEYMEQVKKNGIFFGKIPILVTGIWIFANFGKALPVYSRLQFEDQVSMLKSASGTALLMFFDFYSAQCKSETMISYEGGVCCYSVYTSLYTDPILLNAARKIFVNIPREYIRMDLAKDEFVLLMALLFTNSAIPGLSPQGQQILKGEEEKYGKMLLGLQQRRFGENAGALRYMETLRLLWSTIRQMQKHHEIAIYIDSLYEQGKFGKIVPKSLHQML